MVRAHWTPTAAAFAIAIASMAEGASAGHIAAAMRPIASEVSGLVEKVHGAHRACRHGSYGRRGMDVGWHRHDRGKVYPCAPEATGTQPYSPSTERGPRQGTPGSGQNTTGGTGSGKKPGVSSMPKINNPPPRGSINTNTNINQRFSPSTSTRK
jgi:hypothetical protein